MKITLNDTEIKKGLVDYIASQGINLDGSTVEVDLTAGRGPNGYSADVSIVPNPDAPSTASKFVAPGKAVEPKDDSAIPFGV